MIHGFNSTRARRHPSRWALAAATALAAACALAGSLTSAGAATPQERYDRGQAKLSKIADTVDELKSQIAEDNRTIDSLMGELSGLRAKADRLESELAAKQAELKAARAKLAREREHLAIVRKRLQRALRVLRQQLVAMYETGTPDMSQVVLGASSWGDAVSRTEYVRSIQEYDEAVIKRVSELRDQVEAAVKRMEAQRDRLQKARDAIAVEERQAEAAKDELESRRAKFLATRGARKQRIAALQERAGTIEGNLPDLTSDPASSSAPASPAPVSGQTARLLPDGLAAAPAGAPAAVKGAIEAANSIVGLPYVWGGGHGSFESSGYDCSGAVSFALHGGGLLTSPLDSTGLSTWGEPGVGNWITVYANAGHTYVYIAGLRWDTSDTGGTGPKWHTDVRDNSGFVARHPSGL